MHEIFGTKSWVEPIATAGSSVNTSANTNNDTTNNTENNDAIKSGKNMITLHLKYIKKNK